MNSLSLYNITSAFPLIMEQEEMAPELKRGIRKGINNFIARKKPKYNWLCKKHGINC